MTISVQPRWRRGVAGCVALTRLRGAGIRPVDAALAAAVAGVVDLFVAAASGPGQQPLNVAAYAFGAVLAVPVLFRRRWPLGVLISCTVMLIIYYASVRRNVPPTPLLILPVYDAAVAGYLAWAIAVPACFIGAGVVLAVRSHRGLLALASEYLPRLAGVPVALWLLPILIFPLAVVLGQLIHGRRALAAEAALRLRAADSEREAEAARRVAEERLRIARELHDTVAHSMATIAVQAASALHLLGDAGDGGSGGDAGAGGAGEARAEAGCAGEACAETGCAGAAGAEAGGAAASGERDAQVRDALTAIRATSKSALSEMRGTLGQLRQAPSSSLSGSRSASPAPGLPGLSRLPALLDAVAAAGLPVTVSVEGTELPLPASVDHAAYRILQESLTNVLRHAGPKASAFVRMCYGDAALIVEVTDDGCGASANGRLSSGQGGHGLAGMSERATAVGGSLMAGPGQGGGFMVTASLPLAADRAGR
jgi:signal transduction histidine kinase